MSDKDKDEVLSYISYNVTESEIYDAIDEAIHNYVDSDWEEDGEYDSEWEWYQDHGRNEAENDALHDIVLQASYDLKIALSNDDLEDVIEEVANAFEIPIL